MRNMYLWIDVMCVCLAGRDGESTLPEPPGRSPGMQLHAAQQDAPSLELGAVLTSHTGEHHDVIFI